MTQHFHSNKPIFVQIREKVEDQIVNTLLKEGDQAPSTNQLVHFYKVNHVTAAKGMNQLVEQGVLYKKRGVGMFVADGARQILLKQRQENFAQTYLIDMIKEAKMLGISEAQLFELIRKTKGEMDLDTSSGNS